MTLKWQTWNTTLTSAPSGIVSNKQYADKGDEVKLTCAFTDPKTSTPTVSWYKNGDAYTSGITTTSGLSVLTFASADFSNNGEYKCGVDFGGDFGSFDSTSLRQYVRGAVPTVTGPQFALVGTAVTQSCDIFGDELSSVGVVWTNTKGALATGSRFTQTTTAYSESSFGTSATLVISAATDDDTTSFTCTATYKEDSGTTSGSIAISILSKLYCLNYKIQEFTHYTNSIIFYVQHILHS